MCYFRAFGCVAGSKKAEASSTTVENLSRHFRRSASISPGRERNTKPSLRVSEVRPYMSPSDIQSFIGYLDEVHELTACSL